MVALPIHEQPRRRLSLGSQPALRRAECAADLVGQRVAIAEVELSYPPDGLQAQTTARAARAACRALQAMESCATRGPAPAGR
jgi:hypothetical protein